MLKGVFRDGNNFREFEYMYPFKRGEEMSFSFLETSDPPEKETQMRFIISDSLYLSRNNFRLKAGESETFKAKHTAWHTIKIFMPRLTQQSTILVDLKNNS